MLTALAIIVNGNRILIGKLKSTKIEEYGGIIYVFPSAQSETEQGIKDELIKEVKLQSDLDVSITEKIGERIHPITHNLTQYYLCKEDFNQDIKISAEADIEEFMWVEKEELAKYMPSLFDEVKKYLQIA